VGQHEHVVCLLDAFYEHGVAYFVMQRHENSLQNVIESGAYKTHQGRLPCIFRQLLLGVKHCHSVGIVHRDIKPPNVLLDAAGDVKLSDFASAAVINDDCHSCFGVVGTAAFMSPEMVSHQPYGYKTDVWSCGVTFYLLLFGGFPYGPGGLEESECMQRLAKGSVQTMQAIRLNYMGPNYIPAEGLSQPHLHVRSFVEALLSRIPKERPTAKECLRFEAIAQASSQEELDVDLSIILEEDCENWTSCDLQYNDVQSAEEAMRQLPEGVLAKGAAVRDSSSTLSTRASSSRLSTSTFNSCMSEVSDEACSRLSSRASF
jgi:serine/threonine protein kinase